MPSNNSSNLPTLKRSTSNASLSNSAEHRTTRSSTLNQTNSSETVQPTTTTTRSRFGFPSKTSNPTNTQTNIPGGPQNTPQLQLLRKSTRTSSSSTSQIARPGSALGRPATALGTHPTTSIQTNSRLPQSNIIHPPNPKRRTSSVSSQRPTPFGHTPASNPTRSSDIAAPSELQQQLNDALANLNGTQQECNQWKSRAERAESQIEQSQKDQHEERISFCQEIKQLEDKHQDTIQQIKDELAGQLTRSQEEIESLVASNIKYRDELDKSSALLDRLQSEIEQMDIDSGRSASQVIELTRLNTELETKLQASQSDLEQTVRENQNRIDQVTQHYHNIQSKLHQYLDQMTADYQASLQQQALYSSPQVLNQSKSKIHQLEQNLRVQEIELRKSKAELDRLLHSTAQHEEEKREWDSVRHSLEQQLQDLNHQQQMSTNSYPHQNGTPPVKVENDSSIYEHQLIDFTMMIGDSKSDILSPQLEGKSADKTNQPYHTGHSSPANQAQDSSTLGLSFLGEDNPLEADQLASTNNLANDFSQQSDARSASSDETIVNAVPREVHERTLTELKNVEAELEHLQSELNAVNQTISNLRKTASDAENDQATTHIAARLEFESIRSDLETQLIRSQQSIDQLKASTVPLESHQKTLEDLKTLESELANLKVELISSRASSQESINNLASSQQIIQALEVSLSSLKKDSTEELDRLSRVHAHEIVASAERIKCLQADLDHTNSLHAQALSKLNELTAFNPQQISVLTSRLREERDESRRAIEFVQVERQVLEETSRDIISKLQLEQQQVLSETTAERNTLVVAILTLQKVLKSWKHESSLTKLAEANEVQGCPKAEEASMDASFNATNISSNISLASHLRGDLGFDLGDKVGPEATSHSKSEFGPDDLANEVHLQAYETALDPISSLSKQVDELKEQLLQTYVAHQEQEKLALLDVEKIRSELISSKELYSQVEEDQARTISSLELQYSGLQHQFHNLEISYNTLRRENEDLKHGLDEETEKSNQLKVTQENMQTSADTLRSQIESMDSEMRTYKQQITELQEQYSLACEKLAVTSKKETSMQATTDSLRHQMESMSDEIQAYKQHIADLQVQHSLVNEDLAVTSEKQTSQLTIQVEQLTHDLKQQERLAEDLKVQLDSALMIQKEHVVTVQQLEETLRIQKIDRRTELENKESELGAQRGDLEKQLSELQFSLDEKSALNIQLQESVSVLNAQILEHQEAHRTIQAESETKLSQAIEHRTAVDEKHQLLQNQVEELLEKMQALEVEKGSLTNQLEIATEEQKPIREKMAAELSHTQKELAEVTNSRDLMAQQLDQMNGEVRLLTEELEQLKSEQILDKQSSEKYETLLSEFKALEEQLPTLSTELEMVRSELESASGMVEDMTTEVKEKDSMINSLKADLATVSKLHRSISSVDTAEHIKELEDRVQSKTVEAEEAVDRLLDEMQKNKRLANLVETLKIKLKSKAKSSIPPPEHRLEQESGEDPGRVASSSAQEPDSQSASTSSRKRKHEAVVSDIVATRLRSQIDDVDDSKENPGGINGRQSVRRKISATRDEEELPEDTHGVLQPVSVNKQNPILVIATSNTKECTKDALKSGHKPLPATTTTNSNLLASIRRKQQQKQQSISALSARGNPTTNPSKLQPEPRRSSLRLVRKDQENT